MDVFLPECRYLQPRPQLTARLQQWRKALALPEDALTWLLEILKFLGTGALILATAVILLMAG